MEQAVVRGKVFVVVDLSSCVVVQRKSLQRCVDTAMMASDVGLGTTPPLQTIFDTLDRVFVAHVTSDPFASELPGTSELLRRLAEHGYPIFGVGTLAPSIIAAASKRFDWRLPFGAAQVATPLWTAAERAAKGAGFDPSEVAMVSDDIWELAHAAREGCGYPICVGEPPFQADARILRASSMRAVASLFLGRTSERSRISRPREESLSVV